MSKKPSPPRKKAPKRGKAKAAAQSTLPTREQLLEFIDECDQPPGKREIARAFHIKGADRVPLKAMLRELEEEGLLERGEKRTLSKPGTLPPVTVLDIFDQDSDGELLARPANWKSDAEPPSIVMAPATGKEPLTVGVGDRVLARLSKAEEDFDYEARIIRKLGQGAKTILGILRAGPGADFTLEAVDKRERNDFQVAKNDAGKAKPGELVEAELLSGPRYGARRARVREALGPMEGPRSISLIAIHAHGLPTEFDPKAIEEAENAKAATARGRTDLRDVPLITIDPADARDHDDAVWAAPDDDPNNEGGMQVIVAIADVAGYVRPGSALDKDAWKRGNSAYFPDRVVPMLPERISNDLCSLREKEDRPCLAVRMVFDKNGKKKRHEFMRAIMRSAAKLSYQQAQAAFDGSPDDAAGPLTDTVIKPLYAAWHLLTKSRGKRSPLDLDLPERKIILNKDGHIADIREAERLDSMRLIEEFMIQANVCAAETLEAKNAPVMYRVHDAPAPEKLMALADFLQTMDISLPRGAVIKPAHLNRILNQVVDSEFANVVNEVVLRSMAQAVYSPENLGHFGLNLERYAHFTSPIRRYADLLVHRSLIRALKLSPNADKDGLRDDEIQNFEKTAEHISTTERRAMTAERDSTDRYLAAYLADRVGVEFNGKVSGVTRFGLFIRLDETGADGLVPVASLTGDYFHHSETMHALVGERTGTLYRLGERVRVRLEEAAPMKGGLRFDLVEGGRKATKAELARARADRKASGGGRRGRGAPRGGGKGIPRSGKRKSTSRRRK